MHPAGTPQPGEKPIGNSPISPNSPLAKGTSLSSKLAQYPKTILIVSFALILATWPRISDTSSFSSPGSSDASSTTTTGHHQGHRHHGGDDNQRSGAHSSSHQRAPVIAKQSCTGHKPTTDHCERPGQTQFSVMMDAGSTGSRTHIFKFAPDGSLSEVFKELKPGLSSFKDSPQDAARSLLPLMKDAFDEVPPEMHGCTPLALKATAGLRLVGHEKSNAILREVEEMFRQYCFNLPKHSAVVMDGKDEGPYAWVTVNYLLNTLGAAAASASGSGGGNVTTAAILDMGGASTQLVFIPDKLSLLDDVPMENVFSATIKNKKYRMYTHSHLGYGLKEAGKKIIRIGRENQQDYFACGPPGQAVSLVQGEGITNQGTKANFFDCVSIATKILNKQKKCSHDSCSFNGVPQPSLHHSFSGPIYVFSYFYDRMEAFLAPSGRSSVGEFKDIGEKICASADSRYANYNKGTMCLDFAYLYALMSIGYDLPDTKEIHIKKKINGIETAWALGASLLSGSD